MTQLIFVRHGETDWNVEGRWQGQKDIPLNQYGIEQAQRVARELAQFDISAIYSSDLSRARQTAEALAMLKQLPVHVDKRWREIHQGEWEGVLGKDIEQRYADLFQKRHRSPLVISPPGGETIREVRKRVLKATTEILRNHPREMVVVFSHGFVIAVIRTTLEKKPLNQVWELIPNPARWWTINISHLD